MKKQSVTTPKISVIIPVYNVEKYLRQCLDCVVAQTLREIEIICVDDGSTDDSLKILNEYAASDKRITVLKQQNKGAGAARNAGMAAAKGEFLSFLDSDDFFEPNMLETMYDKAQEDGSDIVVCGYYKYDQQLGKETVVVNINKAFLNNSPIVPEEFGSNLFEVCYPNPWSKIFKRELLINNKLQFENLKSCNDITCVMTAEALAGKISAVNKPFVYYRCNTGSQTSTSRFGRNECFISAAAALEKNLRHFGLYDKFYDKLRYEMDSCLRFETKGDIKLLQDFAQKHLSPRLYNDLYAEYDGPKVSVIIPVYNVEKYLRQCLDSVVNQTLQEIEIICIDDGSTDNSPKILKEYAAKDKRIKIIKQKNAGQAMARNNALAIAEGKYAVFVDSDDCLVLNALEKIFTRMEKNRLEMLSYSGINFDNATHKEAENLYWDFHYLPKNFDIECFSHSDARDFIQSMVVSTCLTAYKLRFIKIAALQFPPHLCFEDNLFFIKAVTQAERIGIMRDKLYRRRIHSVSTTQNGNKHFADYVQVAALICEYLQETDEALLPQYAKYYGQNIKSRFKILNSDEKKQYKPLVEAFIKRWKFAAKDDALSGTIKSVHTYKLFNFIPLLTVKQRGGSKVYKILGLPIWKVRKMADNLTAKYYFCGIPLLKKQTKENRITTKYKLFGLPFLKVSKKKIEQER